MIHNINPIIISFGSFHIYWYGFMYLIAFLAAWLLGNLYIKKNIVNIDNNKFSDLLFLCFLKDSSEEQTHIDYLFSYSQRYEKPMIFLMLNSNIFNPFSLSFKFGVNNDY